MLFRSDCDCYRCERERKDEFDCDCCDETLPGIERAVQGIDTCVTCEAMVAA